MIIGIVGRARVGKDTFASILAEELFDSTRFRFVLIAYATELKKRLQYDFDLSYEQLWGSEKETPDFRYKKRDSDNSFWTAREIMQFIGTECYRSVDSDFWVKQLFRIIDDNEYSNVIITDIRFPEEAVPVSDRGGYLIKVTSVRELEEINGNSHSSEVSMDNYDKIDYHVKNDGTIDELRGIAKQVVKFILKSEELKTRLSENKGD